MALPQYIVFSGGGFAALVYIGVLRYLTENSINITSMAGTSMGAMFALMLSIGMDYSVIEERAKTIFTSDDFLSVSVNWFEWVESCGFDDGKRLIRFFDGYIPPNMTFVEHAKSTGKHLVICATNLQTLMPVYFSVDNTPNVTVLDAVRASCCFPGIITPVKIGTDYFVDGGLTMSVPVLAFPDAKADDVLVCTTYRRRPGIQSQIDKPNAISMLIAVSKAAVQNHASHTFLAQKYKNIITFPEFPLEIIPLKSIEEDSIFMCITSQNIDDSISVGYAAAHKFFAEKSSYILPAYKEK